MDAELAVPVPDSLPDEIAAQMLVNPVTVLMLRRAAQQHFSVGFDGVVLNNAAASAVGRLFHRSQRAIRRGTETLTKSSSIPYRSTVALSLRGANSRQRLGPARKPRNCSFNDAHAPLRVSPVAGEALDSWLEAHDADGGDLVVVRASGYYEWRSRAPSQRAIRHAWITEQGAAPDNADVSDGLADRPDSVRRCGPWDGADRERMQFQLDNLIAAAAPTNNPALNPLWPLSTAAAPACSAESPTWYRDLDTSPRIPSMVSPDAFSVGKTVP